MCLYTSFNCQAKGEHGVAVGSIGPALGPGPKGPLAAWESLGPTAAALQSPTPLPLRPSPQPQLSPGPHILFHLLAQLVAFSSARLQQVLSAEAGKA